MASETNVSELIANIYDTLTEDASWGAVLTDLSDALNCEGAYLMIADPSRRRLISSEVYNLDSECLDLYAKEFVANDPRLNFVISNNYRGLVYDYLHTSETEIKKSDLYAFLDQYGYRYYLNIQIFSEGDLFGGLSFQRTPAQGHVTREELELAASLEPHLRRVVRAKMVLEQAELQASSAEAALDRLRVGVIFLDSAGNVMHMSRPAERLLSERDGVAVVGRRLIATSAESERELKKAIHHAIGTGQGQTAMGSALAISRPSMRRPYHVLVCPISLATGPLAVLRPAAMVFVLDSEILTADLSEILMRMHRFTEAEADMAADLVGGWSLADHAERRQLTLNTARWRLKQLQAKTETNSQMELMRVLLGGLSGVLAR